METQTTNYNQIVAMLGNLFPNKDIEDIYSTLDYSEIEGSKKEFCTIKFQIDNTPSIHEVCKALNFANISDYWVGYTVYYNRLNMTISNFDRTTMVYHD